MAAFTSAALPGAVTPASNPAPSVTPGKYRAVMLPFAGAGPARLSGIKAGGDDGGDDAHGGGDSRRLQFMTRCG